MLRRLSVRGKILATLAVPIVVLIVIASLIVGQAVAAALVGGESRKLAESTPAHDVLMYSLQQEYSATLQLANGAEISDTQLESLQMATDRALSVYREETSNIDFSRFSPNVVNAWNNAQAGLRGLDRDMLNSALADRANIDPEPTVVAVFSSVIRSQESFYDVVTDSLSDRDLAGYFALYASTFQFRAAYAEELRNVGAVVDERATIPSDDPRLSNAISAIQAHDQLAVETSEDLVSLGIREISVPEPSSDHAAIRDAVLASRPNSITSQQADVYQAETSDFENRAAIFQDGVRVRLISAADDAATQARTQAFITAGAALAAVLLSLVIAFLISRRIVVPLSRLTVAATQVRDELPKLVEQVAVPGVAPTMTIDPIEVKSSDEIGQLATVFNDMNDTTVEVAREQAALRGSIAEMFVNVARRDHTLLNRQLSFLDELERAEEDPTVLSNLFRLDHLATRMRRNSESLLVLAGIDSGRRIREPMALSDVVRTASSEIEAYDRISLTLLDDPLMLGHHALSAAHLMAELLENATMFSDPSHQVEVTTNADDDYVSVAIRDFGLGMSEEELAEANAKVTSKSASEVVGAQRLGLLVVGRLADRLGAHVNFESAPDGGTLVIVAFPRKLFVETTSVEQETVDPVAPVARSAADIQNTDEWVPPAPVAPVDLAALTDGTTASGMPRRRGSGAEPSLAESSAPLPVRSGGSESPEDAGQLDEDAIVLPEIAAPDVSAISVTADEDATDWQPLQQANFAPGGLPSRGGSGLPTRSAAPTPATGASGDAEVDADEHAPVMDTERRASMFSRFRASSDLAELAASSDQSADDQTDAADSSAVAEELAGTHDPASDAPQQATSSALPQRNTPADYAADFPERAAIFSQFRTSADLADQNSSAEEEQPESEEQIPTASVEDLVQAVPDSLTAPLISDGEEPFVPEFNIPKDSLAAISSEESMTASGDSVDLEDSAPETSHEPESETDDMSDESRIILPRHASPEDLERLLREYGGPEGVSAAITGPIPIVAASQTSEQGPSQPDLDGDAHDDGDTVADAVDTAPDEQINDDVPALEPDPAQDAIPQLEPDEYDIYAQAQELPDGDVNEIVDAGMPQAGASEYAPEFGGEQPVWEQPDVQFPTEYVAQEGQPAYEQQPYVPVTSEQQPFVPNYESAPVVDTPQTELGGEEQPDVSQQPIIQETTPGFEPGVTAEQASTVPSDHTEAATAVVPEPPSFNEIVAQPDSTDDAPAVAKPKKRGFFARLFGRKKKDEPKLEQVSADEDSRANEPLVKDEQSGSNPASIAQDVAAAATPAAAALSDSAVESGAPAEQVVPTPGASFAPEPTAESSPAVAAEEEWSAPQVSAPSGGLPSRQPAAVPPSAQTPLAGTSWSADPQADSATLDSSTGDVSGEEAARPSTPRQGSSGLGAFFAKSGPAQESGWSPDAVVFDPDTAPSSMSPELAAMLASRADLQDQALAELSQLSSYRPQEVAAEGGSGLVRRKKAKPVPATPQEEDPTKQRITRDAAVLRTRLAAFQSGTSRGRKDGAEPSGNSSPSPEGDSH